MAPRDEHGIQAQSVVLLTTASLTGVVSLAVASGGLHAMAFRGAVVGTIAFALGLLALAVVWQKRARRVVLNA